MRRAHFETLEPICPRCALEGLGQHKLQIASVFYESGDIIVDGIIKCDNQACQMMYPIIDGIPIIISNIDEYIAHSQAQILQTRPLHDDLQSLLADAIGPNSEFIQTRQHLSTYCWGHYADFDPQEDPPQSKSSMSTLLDDCAIDTIDWESPAIDLGCSVGRSSFELAARTQGMVLGVDLSFAMLRKAQAILINKQLSYGQRRIGIDFERREFSVGFENSDMVDFWACDLLALPFRSGIFNSALALNVLDCVNSPRDLLSVLRALLSTNGTAILATPFDWTESATPVASWVGGQSQRGDDRVDSKSTLRELLTMGTDPAATSSFEITKEIDAAHWITRLHDRSTVHYRVYAVLLRALS